MASAALIHCQLDPGKLVCWLRREYIGERREVKWTLRAMNDHLSTEKFDNMKRILLDGCPFELAFYKPLSSKTEMIKRENFKSFN